MLLFRKTLGIEKKVCIEIKKKKKLHFKKIRKQNPEFQLNT